MLYKELVIAVNLQKKGKKYNMQLLSYHIE